MRSGAPRVDPAEVQLIAGRVIILKGGGKRLYWHVFHAGKHAGHVSIDYHGTFGNPQDASIDVQLNKRSQGRGIGTLAFRRACELSGLPEVLASIRKGNHASRIAAERAGFFPLDEQPSGELLMVWRRT